MIPLAYAQMMRFDAQTPAVREAMRYAHKNLRIKFCERLTVESVRARDRIKKKGGKC